MPPEAAEIQRWLAKAEHDRRAAEALLDQNPPITDAAGFHCQQAVEKLLKAYLFSRAVDFERTHDLRVLVLTCAERDSEFAGLLDRVAALTAYAVRFRYPGPTDPTVGQVRRALEVVDEVRRFVLKRLTPTSH